MNVEVSTMLKKMWPEEDSPIDRVRNKPRLKNIPGPLHTVLTSN